MKLWKKITHLGIKENDYDSYIRYIKLSNALNAFVIIIFITIYILTRIDNNTQSFFTFDILYFRNLILVLISLISLTLSYYKLFKLSRILTATSLPFIFLILPSLYGIAEEESFFYYPYLAVGFTIFPFLLFSQKTEKIAFWVSIIWNIIIVLISDVLILNLGLDFKIIDIVLNNYLFYKIAPLGILFFIIFSILYLKNINYSFEKNLETNNNELEEKNELLLKISNEFEKQNIKLHENQEELETSNEELTEYRTILKDKNEELSETIIKLKETQNKLVQNEKMASLGILTAGIAHEINNPLNFVSAGIQSLEENYKYLTNYLYECNLLSNDLPEKGKVKANQLKIDNYYEDVLIILPKLISNIKAGVVRTEEIVKGLKTFSRIDDAKLIKTNIHKGIDSTLLILNNKYKNRIEIIKNYSSDVKEIICYPGQLNQVFLNIINNGIDAIKDTGTITIKTQKADLNDRKEFNIFDKYIKISIKDTGTGINEKVIDKIFDPFFTTKEVGKGTGLGLSITHGIIEKHNGKVFINSIVNEGSEFILFLPENL